MIACADVVSQAAENPAFTEICERFHALEARKAADEARASFEQAQLIRYARVRLKVPIAAIGEALGLSRQSIHTYRNVAERIDEPLFRELVGERSAATPPFSWSVIAQVARLADQADRRELIDRIRLCGWRTRDVGAYVSSRRGATQGPNRREAGGRRRRADVAREPPSPEGPTVGGSEAGEWAGDVTARVSDLGRQMLALVIATGDAARPALVVAVAEILAGALVEAAQGVASAAGTAPSRELRGARDALTRCAAGVSDARDAIARRLAETEAVEVLGAASAAPPSSARPGETRRI